MCGTGFSQQVHHLCFVEGVEQGDVVHAMVVLAEVSFGSLAELRTLDLFLVHSEAETTAAVFLPSLAGNFVLWMLN